MADQMTQTTQPTQTEQPATPTARRLFTATLILGVPGAGKTSLLAGFCEYLWEVYGKVLLLYSWDGGAIPTHVQRRMKQGLIRYWRARTRSAPGLGLETLYLASRGYWPRRINAETGETAPAVELVPPVTTRYQVTCPKGHALQTVPSRGLVVPMFCTPCGQFVGLSDLQVAETATRTKGFEAVGGVAFDGLTSMSDVVLDHMDIARDEGLIGGEKAAFGGVVQSGLLKFGGTNRADIGFGQSRARQFVQNSLSIPYLVEGPVFTALSFETADEGGLTIVGPKLPGRAATDEASAWFGNVMEMGRTSDEQGRSCFTLFLRPFTDQQNRRHLLKTSSSPAGVPDKLVDPPEESHQPFTVANLGSVFRQLDEDLRRALQEELVGAPGIPQVMAEYGEAVTIEAGAGRPVSQAAAGPLPLAAAPLAAAPGLAPPMPVMAPRAGSAAPAAPAAAPTATSAAMAAALTAPLPKLTPALAAAIAAAPAPAAASAVPAEQPAPAPPTPAPTSRPKAAQRVIDRAAAALTPPGPPASSAPPAPPPSLMVAKPRRRGGSNGPQAIPLPTVPSASTPPPLSVASPPQAEAIAVHAPLPAAPPTTGTAPAPPPGMRPPARLPNT